MHSTLHSITNSAQQRVSSRVCFSPAANNSTLDCIANVRRRTYINLIEINVLGQIGDTLNCETRSFEFRDLSVICYPPTTSYGSTVSINYNVMSYSSLSKIPLHIGSIPSSDKTVNYEAITDLDDLSCYCFQGIQTQTSLSCCLRVNTESKFNVITVDVGYNSSGLLNCITKSEAHTDLRCSIVTRMKTTTRNIYIHEAVTTDDFDSVSCICYRIAGPPAQVQPLLVIGGYRHITERRCLLTLPIPSISDVLCCNHGTVDGAAAYTTTRSNQYLTLNIYNIGSKEIQHASLKQNGAEIPHEQIKFSRNLWVVKFNTGSINLGKDYFITLKMKHIDKIFILDAVKGKLNLGY